MENINFNPDKHSLSEFCENPAYFISMVSKKKNPMIITQNGENSTVLMDAGEYEKLLLKIQILQEVSEAEKQFKDGKGIEHDAAFNQLINRFKK